MVQPFIYMSRKDSLMQPAAHIWMRMAASSQVDEHKTGVAKCSGPMDTLYPQSRPRAI